MSTPQEGHLFCNLWLLMLTIHHAGVQLRPQQAPHMNKLFGKLLGGPGTRGPGQTLGSGPPPAPAPAPAPSRVAPPSQGAYDVTFEQEVSRPRLP